MTDSSGTAPSADEALLRRSGRSSVTGLSLKSHFSKDRPMNFSLDPLKKNFEDPEEALQDLQEEAEPTPDQSFQDHLLLDQSADVLERLQKFKSSLKHKYEAVVATTQSTRVWDVSEQKLLEPLVDCTDLLRGGRGSVRTLLTTGAPGVGKSVLVQRSVVAWCEDRALQHIQLLCPLPFSQLNLVQQQSWTLMELLWTFWPELRECGLTELPRCRMLFILDGLDECRLPLDFSSGRRHCQADAAMPVEEIVSNLMLGNLLPDAQLWITSRPTAARSIPSTLIHRVTEVQGFSSLQREAYFLQHIQDQDRARSVVARLGSCAPLLSLSHLPLVCSITASVCSHTSISHMFLLFLCSHMRNMQHKYGLSRSRAASVIQALSCVALEQLQRGELLFYEDQLRASGADVTEALVSSGLCTQLFTEDKAFTFITPSLHHFLAALFVHTSFSEEEEEELHQTQRHHPLFLLCLHQLSLDSTQSLLRPLVEPRRPLVEPQNPLVEPQNPLVEPWCPLVEPQSPLVELQRPLVEPQRPLVEPQRPLVEPQRPLVLAHRNQDFRLKQQKSSHGGHRAVSSLCRSQARINGEGEGLSADRRRLNRSMCEFYFCSDRHGLKL